MKYKIFVDMDGVITDLKKEFLSTGKCTEEEFKSHINDEIFWKIANEAGIEFWSKMEWAPNGKELWNLVLPYSPIVLSAYTKDGIYTKDGKKIWIKNNLGNVKYILCLREDKQKYANSNSILIDDREDNIREWRQRGGVGVLYNHKDFDNIKLIIKEYLK